MLISPKKIGCAKVQVTCYEFVHTLLSRFRCTQLLRFKWELLVLKRNDTNSSKGMKICVTWTIICPPDGELGQFPSFVDFSLIG